MTKSTILKIAIPVIAMVFAYFLYVKYRVPPQIEFFDLTTTDLEANPSSLHQYAGKNIFITMWAPWCADCIKEMPSLQALSDKLADEDFVFVAISGYDIDKERKFRDNNPYNFEYLHMSESLKEIGVHSIPTNYIINKKGKVVYQKVGSDNWSREEKIDEILDLVY